MNEERFISYLALASIIIAVGTFISLFFITAPYGRHVRKGWGPTLPNRLSWVIMEAPSAILFVFFFFIGTVTKTIPIVIFLFSGKFITYTGRSFTHSRSVMDGKRCPQPLWG